MTPQRTSSLIFHFTEEETEAPKGLLVPCLLLYWFLPMPGPQASGPQHPSFRGRSKGNLHMSKAILLPEVAHQAPLSGKWTQTQ